MLAPTQNLQDLTIKALTLPALDRSFPLTDITQSIPQLSDNADSLQTPISEPIAPTSYSESDYDWLVDVLDTLIKFVRRDENWSVPELRKNDYDWAHAMLVELVGAVGEGVTHPLRPSMEFVSRLVANYEDKYVPQLTELFPELIKEKTTEPAAITNSLSTANSLELNEDKLAANAFFSIGCLLSAGEKLEKALAAYDTAIVLKPDFVEGYHNRAMGLQQLGKYEEAIIDLEQAIGLEPDSAELHYKRGCTKGSSNQPESAIVDFDKAINLNPNYAEAYCCRGLMKSGLGEYKSAIDDFDRAIELKLNPDFVNIYYIKGIVNAEYEQYEEAIADFDEAIRLKPDYAEAYDSRGIVKNLLKRYESAISDHTTAIDITPDFVEAYLHRGAAKVESGRIDEARLDFQKVLELAEQQGNTEFKAAMAERLQELNNLTPQDSEN